MLVKQSCGSLSMNNFQTERFFAVLAGEYGRAHDSVLLIESAMSRPPFLKTLSLFFAVCFPLPSSCIFTLCFLSSLCYLYTPGKMSIWAYVIFVLSLLHPLCVKIPGICWCRGKGIWKRRFHFLDTTVSNVGSLWFPVLRNIKCWNYYLEFFFF